MTSIMSSLSDTADIHVVPLENEDIPICFQVLSKSFGHNAPFVDVYFPDHDTPAGQAQGSKRLTSWKDGSLSSTFLKAVASNSYSGTDTIVGLAIWTLMKTPPPAAIEEAENVEEVWPDKQDREFMSQLWKQYVIPRTETIKASGGKGVYVLELLAVHPEYQGLGAGTKLVMWGTEKATDLGVKAVVESTPAGRRVYEKCGLRVEIEEMHFGVGEEFADRAKPKLIFLTKEPGSS
ncbi:hypothetical protein F5Y14DRAFT_13222 [Nemania sp. NC0429]|nr:hypothetical protein F5Y14DRAFT_13222 [Nemania sp. NC0429]